MHAKLSTVELYRTAPNSNELLSRIATEGQLHDLARKVARTRISKTPTFREDRLFSAERSAVKILRDLGAEAVPGFQMFGKTTQVEGSYDLATNIFYKAIMHKERTVTRGKDKVKKEQYKAYEQMVWIETHGLEMDMRIKTDRQMYGYFDKLESIKRAHPENRLLYVTDMPSKFVEREYSIDKHKIAHRMIFAPNNKQGNERLRHALENLIKMPNVRIEKDRGAWLKELEKRAEKEIRRKAHMQALLRKPKEF